MIKKKRKADEGLQVCGHGIKKERHNDSSRTAVCAEIGSFFFFVFFIYESRVGEAWVNIDRFLCLRCSH